MADHIKRKKRVRDRRSRGLLTVAAALCFVLTVSGCYGTPARPASSRRTAPGATHHTTQTPRPSSAVRGSASLRPAQAPKPSVRPTAPPNPSPRPTAAKRPGAAPKPSDPHGAGDYAHPDDFYYDHYDDFFDYEDAEDYWEDHN